LLIRASICFWLYSSLFWRTLIGRLGNFGTFCQLLNKLFFLLNHKKK
jgi:hypothetical protein